MIQEQGRVLSDTTEYLKVSPEDLSLYFADTYLWFNDTKCWEYVQGPGATVGGGIILRSVGTGSVKERALSDLDVSFEFPEIGLYNFKKGIVSFRRKTERQNKKALCPSTAHVIGGIHLFSSFALVPPVFNMSQLWRWNIVNVQNLFGVGSDKFPEFEDVYTDVKRMKAFARIFNRQFFLGQGLRSKHPSLWFRHSLIGRAVSTKEIVIENPAFLQEALDFFVPQGVSVDVEETKTNTQ